MQKNLNVRPPHWWLHSTFGFEEQHAKKKDDKKRVAKYSITAGWPETKLIIIIVKKAQRKPAAFPFPPQSNREAFSLHNDLQSDKTNRFAVTAWKGPARTPLLIMWPDLKPFSYSPSLCHLPTTPACSRGQQRMRLAQWWQATIQSLPAPHKPLQMRGTGCA